MPVNLPPQYHQKEAELKTAKTLEEKISILEELLTIMPKHKASEKLQALLRTKIAKYKKVIEKKPQAVKKQTVPTVIREGAGQIVFCGPPNTGKSTLLSVLTKAKPDIAEYPFTTKTPCLGMLQYADIKIQLVDTPSLSFQFSENWLGDILRKADALVFLFDLSSDSLLEEMEDSLTTLERFRIKDEATFTFTKKILWAGNKTDVSASKDIKEVFTELYKNKIQDGFLELSAKEGINLEQLPEHLFNLLEIMRVYTKIPGKPPDKANPFTLKKGSSVIELADIIHKDIAKNFKYARLWRIGDDKIAIAGRDYKLEDGDIVEVHV